MLTFHIPAMVTFPNVYLNNPLLPFLNKLDRSFPSGFQSMMLNRSTTTIVLFSQFMSHNLHFICKNVLWSDEKINKPKLKRTKQHKTQQSSAFFLGFTLFHSCSRYCFEQNVFLILLPGPQNSNQCVRLNFLEHELTYSSFMQVYYKLYSIINIHLFIECPHFTIVL